MLAAPSRLPIFPAVGTFPKQEQLHLVLTFGSVTYVQQTSCRAETCCYYMRECNSDSEMSRLGGTKTAEVIGATLAMRDF